MRSFTRTVAFATAALLHCGTLHAQHFIDLRSVRLSGEGWPPDAAAHSIVVDSVITTFDPARPVGWVIEGISNGPVDAFIKGELRAELKGLLDRLHTGGPDGRHMVMKIDTLDLTERTLVAHCRFSAEMIERSDSGWTRLYTFGTTLAQRDGMDATNNHAENITHALDNCLRRTAWKVGPTDHTGVPLSARQLQEPFRRQVRDLRSVNNGRPLPGIYYTYMDFVDHTPDTTTVFAVKETMNATELTRVVNPSGSIWALKAWGLSDGERLYVSTGREYNEVTIARDGLHTYWTPYGAEAKGAGDAMAAGTAGGAPVRLDIDLNDGSLSRAHKVIRGPRDSEHWFCYSRHSKTDTAACLFLYGGEEACLHKGQYHVVHLAPRVETVPMELWAGGRLVQVELDTNADTDQVYLVSVKEDGTLKVDKLSAAMARDVLDRLDPEEAVK